MAHISSSDASSPQENGSIVSITTEKGERLGSGVWDPVSPIAVRIWTLDPRAHLNAAMFRRRLENAIQARRSLFQNLKRHDDNDNAVDPGSAPNASQTTTYRLLNGEGDRVPGYVVDRYADVAVLRMDGDAARAVAPDLLSDIEEPLRAIGITTLLERTGRRGEPPAIHARFGPLRDKVEVQEHGVRFVVDVARGQKTGAFLDQRENRRRIGELVARRVRRSRERGLPSDSTVSARANERSVQSANNQKPVRVLNLFSYTGGFSLRAAIAGGIVTSVDVAMAAHATAQESFRRAGLDPRAHEFATADCFAWLEKAKTRGEKWDVVISDPPSFAPSEKAKSKGLAAYRALHRACTEVLAEGGTFVAASCSSHVTAEELVTATLDDAALGRSDLRLLELFGLPPDHPTLPAFPEGRYLKLAILE